MPAFELSHGVKIGEPGRLFLFAGFVAAAIAFRDARAAGVRAEVTKLSQLQIGKGA